MVGEEKSESVKIVDGKRTKLLKTVEIYSDGSRVVKETNEDEHGVNERRYRLDREGNQLRLEGQQQDTGRNENQKAEVVIEDETNKSK